MLPLLLLAACAPSSSRDPAPADAREQALMDEIETSVRLPAGANPLSGYGRSYAYAAPGEVRAVYLVPYGPPEAGQGCEVMTEDSKSRPCTAREVADAPASGAGLRAAQVPAGKRRWIKDVRALPRISDGGCMQVTIDYDVAARKFLSVACNGEA